MPFFDDSRSDLKVNLLEIRWASASISHHTSAREAEVREPAQRLRGLRNVRQHGGRTMLQEVVFVCALRFVRESREPFDEN